MVEKVEGEPRKPISENVIAEENRAAREAQGTDDSHVVARGEVDPAAADGEKPEPKEPPKPRPGPFEDKRAAMMEKARQLRHAADDGELVDQIAESRASRFAPETPIGGREGIEKKPESPAAPVPGAKRTLTVHGKPIELTEEQIAEHAQKSLAADGILEAAKAERREAQQILEGLRAARENPPAPSAEPQPAAKPKPATILDDAKMAELVDRIQVGDPKDAQAAFQEYGDAIEQRVLAKIGNIDERMAATADIVSENRRRQDETRKTLASFGDKNSEFKADEDLQLALAGRTLRIMREEMSKLGVEDTHIQGAMQRFGIDRETAIGATYRKLSEDGHKLPSHGDILERSAAEIRKVFGAPEKAPARTPSPEPRNDNMAERIERKRVLTPQPRRATPPNSPAGDQQERSQADSRLKAVQQMRAYRRGR